MGTLVLLINEHALQENFSNFSTLLALIRACSFIVFLPIFFPARLLHPARLLNPAQSWKYVHFMPVCDLKALFFDWDGIKVWEKFDTKYLQMILWEVKVRDTEEYIFDGMVLKFK